MLLIRLLIYSPIIYIYIEVVDTLRMKMQLRKFWEIIRKDFKMLTIIDELVLIGSNEYMVFS